MVRGNVWSLVNGWKIKGVAECSSCGWSGKSGNARDGMDYLKARDDYAREDSDEFPRY
jgi:hypothetical protein